MNAKIHQAPGECGVPMGILGTTPHEYSENLVRTAVAQYCLRLSPIRMNLVLRKIAELIEKATDSNTVNLAEVTRAVRNVFAEVYASDVPAVLGVRRT